jgi:RimJ/RimL family protein N-acetyltransferase
LDRHIVFTEHLQLVPITFADADRVAVLHADARVMNLLKHGVLDRAESDRMVADYAAEWPALGFGCWTITERSSGQLIGLGGLRAHEGNRSAALRIALIPEVQGKGYGPEFGHACMDFAFGVARLDRIVGITRTSNLPGQKALEKFGMQREREYDGDNGHRLVIYVMTAAFRPNSGRTSDTR